MRGEGKEKRHRARKKAVVFFFSFFLSLSASRCFFPISSLPLPQSYFRIADRLPHLVNLTSLSLEARTERCSLILLTLES